MVVFYVADSTKSEKSTQMMVTMNFGSHLNLNYHGSSLTVKSEASQSGLQGGDRPSESHIG